MLYRIEGREVAKRGHSNTIEVTQRDRNTLAEFDRGYNARAFQRPDITMPSVLLKWLKRILCRMPPSMILLQHRLKFTSHLPKARLVPLFLIQWILGD